MEITSLIFIAALEESNYTVAKQTHTMVVADSI